jgi:hypothetical protein
MPSHDDERVLTEQVLDGHPAVGKGQLAAARRNASLSRGLSFERWT